MVLFRMATCEPGFSTVIPKPLLLTSRLLRIWACPAWSHRIAWYELFLIVQLVIVGAADAMQPTPTEVLLRIIQFAMSGLQLPVQKTP